MSKTDEKDTTIWVYYQGGIDGEKDNVIKLAMGEDLWYGSGVETDFGIRDQSFDVVDPSESALRAQGLKDLGIIDNFTFIG